MPPAGIFGKRRLAELGDCVAFFAGGKLEGLGKVGWCYNAASICLQLIIQAGAGFSDQTLGFLSAASKTGPHEKLCKAYTVTKVSLAKRDCG